MEKPPKPPNEKARLEDLFRYEILDSSAEREFDDITALASQICRAPIALISLVDSDRQWFKSKKGLRVSETDRNLAFCAHAILAPETFIVPDSSKDLRFADNPLVTGEPNVRFYAGAPLTTPRGQRIGTLCVIDHVPRDLDASQRWALEALSRQVINQMELRLKLRHADASRRELDQFFELSQDLLCVASSEGYFTRVNSALERALNYRSADLIERSIFDFVHPPEVEAARVQLNRLAQGLPVTAYEVHMLPRDGEPILVSWMASPSGSGRIYAVGRDVTERAQLERQLIEARDEAEKATRTKARFLANMSHEIRTPMNGVIGMSNLLLDSVTDRAQLEKIEIIQKCGNTLLDLINDILDFSKIEAERIDLENEPFDLQDAVSGVLDVLRTRAAEKGVDLVFEMNLGTPAWVRGDVTRFRQILMNLVSNAIKFTEAGLVEVSVRTELDEGEKKLLLFTVKDSGIGIAHEVGEKLFVPFSQVDASTTRRFGGSVLGLAICKGLCESMGGRIWFESQLGEGSTFFFTISVEVATPATSTRPTKELPMHTKTNPLRVLVVEDNRVNQLVAVGVLARLGCRADVAANGLEALQSLARQPYDVVLMDCHMPVMDGFEATREIRALYPEGGPKVYAVTASTSEEDRRRCRQAGMDGFVPKPITRSALQVVMEESSPVPIVFNQEAFLANLGGIDDLGEKMVQAFFETLPSIRSSIEEAFKNSTADSLEMSAHKLKGTVGHFHADEVESLAAKLESLAKLKKWPEAAMVWAGLQAPLERLCRELRPFGPKS